MAALKGSKTAQNLKDAFAGEAFEGIGERSLDGGKAGLGCLNLPAVEAGAIVGERQLPIGGCGHSRQYHSQGQ